MEKIAIIRIRGKINRTLSVVETLKRLNLHRQNSCTLVDEKPEIMGMVNKVKDFVTWGPISPELEKELKEKFEKKDVRKNRPKKFFRLKPPKKGYGKRGIKSSFKNNGSLGPRGDKINDLIKSMI